MNPKQIIEQYKLQPNTAEGGYFAATYTSALEIPGKDLPGFKPIDGKRPICGAIYYFIDPDTFSAMHNVTGDMLYHFYSGDPVEMLLLYPDDYPTRSEVCVFSNDLSSGANPMKLIPGGTWLGSRLLPGGNYAFMGVSMAPGFNPADYTIAKRADLIRQYPEEAELITELTRS
jgi:uncharacterized protein